MLFFFNVGIHKKLKESKICVIKIVGILLGKDLFISLVCSSVTYTTVFLTYGITLIDLAILSLAVLWKTVSYCGLSVLMCCIAGNNEEEMYWYLGMQSMQESCCRRRLRLQVVVYVNRSCS